MDYIMIKGKKHKEKVIILFVVFIIVFLFVSCGRVTKEAAIDINVDVARSKEHQGERNTVDVPQINTNSDAVVDSDNSSSKRDSSEKAGQGTNKNTSGNIIERPYYGMSERLINSTKVGTYSYKESSTVTLEGNGSSYTFIIDSRHAMLVKTAGGIVVSVQYIEGGKKVLWSETSSGFHDWRGK